MTFATELFPYQREAVEKLRRLKVSALYMEMGTGKTRTMLEIIDIKHRGGKIDHVLWMCPCRVINNLKEEIRYQVGELPDWFTVAGIESLQGSDKLYVNLLELVSTHDVYLVVDESNMVKNFFAKRTTRIVQLSRSCKYKSILNGTPVSRNEADMFAQWYILDERILGYKSFYSFAANHLEYKEVRLPSGDTVRTNQIARVLNVEYLTQKIAPYMYQIKKSEAGIDLPRKQYHTRTFGLTEWQWRVYEQTKDIYLLNVDELRSDTIYKLFTALQHVVSGRAVTTYPTERMQTENIFADPLTNPRIMCLDDILDEIGDEQAIIFAKYTQEINEIEYLLDHRGQQYREFTGRVKPKQRQQNRTDFKDGVQFLLANKMCGAYGLNLQFCHNVIFYSNDFDFATRQQAEDRVHRLGQTEDVHIYDIEGDSTIDEFISRNLSNKTSMVANFKQWLDEMKNRKNKDILKKTS